MRTLSQRHQVIVDRVIEHDTPSADLTLPCPIRPQSLEVIVNGLRLNRSMVAYDAERRVVTVPWALWSGDSVSVRATPFLA